VRLVPLAFALILPPLSALADSFGGWDFPVPDGYERVQSPLGVTYTGPNGGFMFLPRASAPGMTATAAATATMDAALPATGTRQEVLADTMPDGSDASIWMVTDTSANYIVMTRLAGGQSATALFITPHTDADIIAAEVEALMSATFAPAALQGQTAPALPAMDWPAPPAGTTATTRPRMSVAQGLAAGIDPETALLPGTFDCYITTEPRAADPRPDIRIESGPGQTYTLTDGSMTGSGSWRVIPDDVFGFVLEFSGPLESSGATYVSTNDGLGQSFDINHPARDTELTCWQDGPAAETTRQQIAAAAPLKGAMDCIRADGPPYKLLYGNGIYIADGARGAYAAALDGDYDTWEGRMTFSGGPYDLNDGILTAEDGTLTMTVSQTWSEGSVFYSSSETTTIATCRMPAAARPDPVYGPDPAPPATAPRGGLPEGLYRSWESRYVFSGTAGTLVFGNVYTYVAPGGRIITDPDWAAIGDLPDCSRTTPSGEEFCGEYRITGGMLTRRDEREYGPDAWDDNASLNVTDTGFVIDEVEYERVNPPSAAELMGTWTLDDFAGSGPGPGGGVGQYTDSDTFWTFTPDGRFEWQTSGTNTTLISTDPILGGVSGGGSSSFSDGGAGTFTLTDIWLDLAFDDGRHKRLPVFASPPDDDGLRSITIDGDNLYSR
jgi:hypothetical protein